MTVSSDAEPRTPTQLFDPTAIGGVHLRNRLYVPAHTTNFALHNRPSERYIAYLAEKARGGAGLIFTEAVRVHPSSLRRFGLGGYDSESESSFADMASTVHAEGARLFGQVMHTGRHDGSEWTGLWSPSALAWSPGQETPHVLNQAEIRLLIDSFARTTARLLHAGFDGAEIHIGHGHLLQQFLSPATNSRSDAYGGTAANRLRIVREVLSAVFANSSDAPIGLRVSADEMLPNGLDIDAMIDICAALMDEFPIAFLHVSHSAYVGDYSLATQMADMSFGSAPFRNYPHRFKLAFPATPVLAVCRMDDVAMADSLLRSGAADLVGMARAHIADPAIARKHQEGRASEVRSCIACNQACVGRLEKTLPIRCVVNPEAGFEREWKAIPAPRLTRRILVVGGGPAGLEAASAAASRGHEVVLIERSAQLGGQVSTIRRLHDRARFGLLVDDLQRAVERAGVTVRLNTELSAQNIAAGEWDEVVVATGSQPAPAFEGELVPEDAIAADGSHKRVVVIDEDGGWPGASLAVHLAAHQHEVWLVTAMDALLPNITVYSRLSLYARFKELGVRIRTLSTIESSGAGVAVTPRFEGTSHRLDDVHIVRVSPRRANDALVSALHDAGYRGPVHLIGDAYSPRTALDATYEGRGAGYLVGVDTSGTWPGPPLRTPYLGRKGGDLLDTGRPSVSPLSVTTHN
ncbi:FAD-dependent oxidoreductase [Nonomuraea sp. NPDC059023]|uniref:oxidoreductase n=1 Tax=unclassified Nonomuraea TaxID=2593643 RepID=UPI0036B61D35